MSEPGWLRWDDVLRAERAAIGGRIKEPGDPHYAALCLSGGGIRSAAYCLGVLQALAKARLLGRFHYASTVSGGGYIGAWLQILVSRFGVGGMQRRLADPEVLEVKHLRSYTNWLMPAGWLSMQGWTTAAIYLRNALLNWLMFGPLFLLFALLCVGARSLFFALQPAETIGAGAMLIGIVFLAVGFGGLVWGTAQACTALPSRLIDAAGRPHYWDPPTIRRRILAPSMVWAFCAPFALAPAWPWLSHGWGAWALPGLFVAGSLAGYGVAATARDGGAPSFSQNFLPWCLGSLSGGLVAHLAIRIAAALPPVHLAEAAAVGGPPFLLLGYATVSAVHAGLRGATQERGRPALGGHLASLDVEWMARISAARLRVAVLWFVLSLSVLSGADAIMRDTPLTGMQPAWLGALLAGPVVAWLGKQAFSQFDALISGKTGLVSWDLLLRAGAVVFAAAVLIGSAMVVQNWLAMVQWWISTRGISCSVCGFVWCQGPAMLGSGGVLLLILTAADRWIQTNRFSMHGYYRERLVAAFVGSARPTRETAPATLSGRATALSASEAFSGFTGKTTVAIVDPSGAVQRKVDIDFDAGTLSVDGGAATAFTQTGLPGQLNTALGTFGSASFSSSGQLTLSATGSNGVAVADSATAPTAKAGRGFSAFFGLNDLVTAPTPTNYATGLTTASSANFTGNITLRLTAADGSPIKDVTVNAGSATTLGSLVTSLNSSASGVGLYGSFALDDATGALAFTPAANSGVSLSVPADTTVRGTGGPSISALFGIGDAVRATRTDAFSVRSDIAADPSKLSLARLDPTVAVRTTGLYKSDASGADALAQAGRSTIAFDTAGGFVGGSQTLSNYASNLSSAIANRAASAGTAKDAATTVATQATARRSSAEGVNLDQELVAMTTYQQAYNASARMVQTVRDMYDILLNMV